MFPQLQQSSFRTAFNGFSLVRTEPETASRAIDADSTAPQPSQFLSSQQYKLRDLLRGSGVSYKRGSGVSYKTCRVGMDPDEVKQYQEEIKRKKSGDGAPDAPQPKDQAKKDEESDATAWWRQPGSFWQR